MVAYEYKEYVVGQEFPVLGVVSLWFGVVFVGVTAVAQALRGSKDTVANSMEVILFALILASGVYLAFRAGQGSLPLAAVPLLINVGTLIIVQGVPFADVWENVRFQSNFSAYEQVIDMVASGELPPGDDGFADLPYRYRRLSENGRVLIHQADGVTRVFFFLDNSVVGLTGYLYRSDGAPPQAEFGGDWTAVLRKRPSWYFCTRAY